MMTDKVIYEDQVFLVVNCPGWNPLVLAALGEIARHELIFDGPMDVRLPDKVPTAIGFHVWEGRYEVTGGETSLLQSVLAIGSWRPALLNDFPRFGLPVPPPRLPEGVLA
jgi:hypothetical protein